MRNRARFLCLILVLGAAGSALAGPPSYSEQVQPFLTKYCVRCHNTDTTKGGVSLETFADLQQPGRKGRLAVPNRPDQSQIILVLEGKGKPMPPRKAQQPRQEEIVLVRAWVAAGARDDTPPGVAKAQPVQPPARDRPAKDRGEVAKKRAELAKELRKLDQKIARGKRGAIKEREKILNKLRRLDREGGEARKQDDD